MNQATFEQQRSSAWREFVTQVAEFESAKNQRLSNAEEKNRFIENFENISRDLALAKSRGYSIALIEQLNGLVTQGHYVIHRSQVNSFQKLSEFFTADFAREVRQARIFVLIATLAFVGPAVVIGALIHHSPHYATSVMSPAALQQIERMYTQNRDRIGRERSSGSDIAMFGFYVANNTQIGLQAFASGILFCVVTIWVLSFNGLFISTVVNHLIVIGLGTTVMSFVAGHSAFELTAIVLSGAAGLMLGYAMIHPGELSRREALRQTGLRAVKIMTGAAFLFVFAAFIEAFWSSLRIVPPLIKYLVGGVFWLLTLSYFLFAGRHADRSTSGSP